MEHYVGKICDDEVRKPLKRKNVKAAGPHDILVEV